MWGWMVGRADGLQQIWPWPASSLWNVSMDWCYLFMEAALCWLSCGSAVRGHFQLAELCQRGHCTQLLRRVVPVLCVGVACRRSVSGLHVHSSVASCSGGMVADTAAPAVLCTACGPSCYARRSAGL